MEKNEQNVDFKDLFLRKSAEFENYKKRKNKEELEFHEYIEKIFLLDFLEIFDNLEALYLNNPNSVEIEIIFKKASEFLKNKNVEEISVLNKKFNYDYCNALTIINDPPGEFDEQITKVFKKGYLYNGKLLRHATTGIYKTN